MEQTQYDVVIIGAGHNGLVTAGYLAADGLSVLVLERQDTVGGAVVSEELYPGFNVPYCAYICYLLQGRVIDDLDLRNHGLDIIPLEYGHFHPFPDGSYLQLDNRSGLQANVEELARFSKRDAEAYPEWQAFWRRAAGILHRYWLKDPPAFAQVFEEVKGTTDEQVWETMLTVSLRDFLEQFFESEYVKAHFIDPVGEGDPSDPGTIISAAYELCSFFSRPEDIGIPRGGIGKITEAMVGSARARGVEVRTHAPVEEVIVEEGVARGVRLASGEEVRSFIVVSNADPKRTYLGLVDPEHLDEAFVHGVKNLKTRGNCVKFLAALRELPDFGAYLGKGYDPRKTAQITICPTVDYCQQSWDDARSGRPTSCPVMDIQIPSVYDPSLAPRGHHVLSNWVRYYPAELTGSDWAEEANRAGECIIDVITQYAPNFRESIIDWTAQSPRDIETREGMTDGNIRHIDITSQQVFSRRMPYRSPIERLYLCGSGTHPGGDITGAPGYNAARTILKDLEKMVTRQVARRGARGA